MIEIKTYKCEVCGKEFTFEDECLAHELKCKTAGLEDSVVMMDSSHNILPLDDWKQAIDYACYIFIADEEASKKLEALFYEYNYIYPSYETEEAIAYPAFFAYQDDDMRWKSFQDIENEYTELLDIKDRMLDSIVFKK